MSVEFFRSTRSLRQDGHGATTVKLLIVAGLVAAWLAWFLYSRLVVFAVSDQARIELDRAVYPIESPVSGRVATNHLLLGREVHTGELLVAFEAETQMLQLNEERTRATGLASQMDALQREIDEQERALVAATGAAKAALEEANARIREAEAGASFAEKELERLTDLHAKGLSAAAELESAQAQAEEKRAAADRLKLAVERLQREQRTQASDRRARLQQLRREATRLEGALASSEAAIRSMEQEVEKQRIRAPVTGRLVEVADLQPGAFANAGDRLAVVAAAGELKAVANYSPAAALGRVQPGQTARLRLEGFPFTQFGSLPATVTSVASEVREGRVRVELEIHPPAGSTIPLQHGLPATAEVEVERVTPATLVLRAVGRFLAKQGPANAQERPGQGLP